MRFLVSIGLIAALSFIGHARGQSLPSGDQAFVRIYVKHGDPWMIKALIEGTSISQPELSTILGFAGIPDKDSSMIESLFGKKGRLVVNPTDNTLLFFPSKG